MENVKETYQIPQFNMGYLMEKVDKLNKRAKKLGLAPIIVETIREYDETIQLPDYRGILTKQVFRMVEVKVEGKAPKFDGWVFIATIEHDKTAKNLIKTIPGIELDHSYRDAKPDCDHCGHMRWRRKTYICRHEDGKEIQVGSTCVKDFLGHTSPEHIAWQCEMLGSVREMFFSMGEYDPDRIPRGEIRIPTRKFLQITAAVIHNHGWVSKGRAMEDPYNESVPTVSLVDEQLFPPTNFRDWITIEPDDAKLAYGALQWAKNLREIGGVFSDYEYNLSVLAKESSIPITAMGLAASMVGVYKMKRDKAKQTKEKRSNDHFGEAKKRYDLELKVTTISGFENDWGYTEVFKMVDPDGNAFCWFTTSAPDLEEGETYQVKATVKKHQEYMGRKETVLTRLKIQ